MLSESAQNAKQNLKQFINIIDPLIEQHFKTVISRYKPLITNDSLKALETYKEITQRDAKRLRASFTYFVYKMYGHTDVEQALQLGIALELTHAYLLLLDDFMDQSDTRRSGPTAHKMLEQYYIQNNLSKNTAEHFGNSIAVTIGVFGFHEAMQLISNLQISNELKVQISYNLNHKIALTSFGQIDDVVNSCKQSVTEQSVLNVLRYKTSCYTYENPIHLGAILAGHGTEQELQKLSLFAIPAGIAFQIQDDILGMFGEPGEMGKSDMDDLKEGKMTLLIQNALQNCNQAQLQVLNNCLGNRNITKQDHEDVKQILIDCGSLEYSMNKAKQLVEQAKNDLLKNKNSLWTQEGLDYLFGISDYMIERTK